MFEIAGGDAGTLESMLNNAIKAGITRNAARGTGAATITPSSGQIWFIYPGATHGDKAYLAPTHNRFQPFNVPIVSHEDDGYAKEEFFCMFYKMTLFIRMVDARVGFWNRHWGNPEFRLKIPSANPPTIISISPVVRVCTFP